MSGTVIWNGYETSLDTVALYIEIKVDYREAPFPETLSDWGLGPEFVQADKHMYSMLTIGGRRPNLIEDGTGIEINAQQYGTIYDAYESDRWDTGDPSGQGDWRGEDYFKNSVGVISTMPTDGYQDWVDGGELTPYHYDERPDTFYIIETISGSQLQTVLNRATSVTQTGLLPDAGLIEVSNYLTSQSANQDRFDQLADPANPSAWSFEYLDEASLVGIDILKYQTEYDPADLSSPMTQGALSYLGSALAAKGKDLLPEHFATVEEAEAFVADLQDTFIDGALDLIEQTRGGTSFSKWVKANEAHVSDLEQSLLDKSDLGKVLSELAVNVRDQSGGTTATIYNTADGWGIDYPYDTEATRFIGSQGSTWVTAYDSVLYAFTGRGSDTLFGGAEADWLAAGKGRDMISAGSGNDQIHGGSGVDDLSGDAGKDRIWGGNGDDWIYGGSQRDRLFGGTGDDYLLGGSGNDFIKGGAGDDWIEGDKGNDTLTGNAGSDTFIFTNFKGSYYIPSGQDTVTDFDADEGDSLVLYLEGYASVAEVKAVAHQDGDDLVIDFGGRQVLTLNDTTWRDVKNSIDIMDVIDTLDTI
ncbi:calcium-binding protein [Donghicola eburneus]|uniref:calcium-binding protein n=1 Tax=Donghicola eburneus TaxID=393278 RepID=UPI0008F18D2C|nr:calcium-binding protein [Donghicola eburneus]SFQ74204.1 Hemolysin-type calcium-binding repeat-containing protein [Donghicola eburneus]